MSVTIDASILGGDPQCVFLATIEDKEIYP
jgi:hypothetical protein